MKHPVPEEASMSRWYVLDESGEPVPEPDLLTAARWFETANRQLAEDLVELPTGTFRVSTVFLGLDHRGWGDPGPPVLWETMVFRLSGPGGHWDDLACHRYDDRAGALAGHAHITDRVRNGQPIDD